MMSVKAVILAPIWGAGIVCVGIQASAVGPGLEEQLFPVLTNQQVSGATRTPTKVCWDWTYTKMRDITYVQNVYVAERDDGVRFPVSQYRPDLGIPTNDSTTAKRGVRRTIPECVHMPAVLADEKHVTIRGKNVYRSLLWQVDQPVAPVDVDMLPSGE